MKRITLLFAAFFGLLPQLVGGAPIHPHCDVKQWGPESSSSTRAQWNIDPVDGLDYHAGQNASAFNDFQFDPSLTEEPPASAIPDCKYEISDITEIKIKFTLDPGDNMVWKSITLSGGGTGTTINVALTPTVPAGFAFAGGTENNYSFEPHLGGNAMIDGPIELRLPNGPIFVTLEGDNNNFTIRTASVSMSGNHYYRKVPEPSTMQLFLITLGATSVFARRLLASKPLT
jgi:hypothetical protein